jgi:hypothetical protein
MRDLIKDSLATLKKSDEYICVTNEGEQISLKEATKKNIPVTILSPKQVVEENLAEAGFPLNDTKFLSDLNELIELLGSSPSGKASSSGRKSFSKEERKQIVEGWPKAQEQGLNKTEYAKQVGVSYQSLINWLR